MSNKHPEGLRDFPASQPWADLIDKGPGNSAPPKRPPADKKSVEQSLANLQKLTGFRPPTEADTKPLEPVKIFYGESPETPPSSPVARADFLHLVPAEAPVAKPASKGRQPKKINPPWHGDSQPSIAIITDANRRARALSSDAGHDKTVRRQIIRKKMGLPQKKLPWKEMLRPLTKEDVATLTNMGFDVPNIPRGTFSYERMLRALKQFRAQSKAKVGA